jgi:phage terminase large subunit-like protein
MSVEARLKRLERIVEDVEIDPRPAVVWSWYDPSCPWGLPPGDCREHPRARPAQRPPEAPWRTWLMLAGRGYGKNRAGSEWVRSLVENGKARRLALVAATAADARDVMVEGESGIMAVCPPWNRPRYEPSKRRLTWPNGAIATTYSADEPERLRGPQHDAALCDEVCSWRRPAAWDNLRFGLRLGTNPRIAVATTPKPTTLLKRILEEATTVKTGGSTFDNRLHLAPEFFEDIISRYEGTRLGRQEIHAEILEVVEGAWFPSFDPVRHVSAEARYRSGEKVRLAIDCGVSRHTGAVFFQVREIDRYRKQVTVFADYYAEGLYSEANALAIQMVAKERCQGLVDIVRLDPASTARTGVGPSAYGEYERVFGSRALSFWPTHLVTDGLDQIELLLGPTTRPADLLIHPDCVHLIAAFNNYRRDERQGEFMPYPLDPNHPSEDMMDALRGGVRDAMPEGRKPQPGTNRVPGRSVF